MRCSAAARAAGGGSRRRLPPQFAGAGMNAEPALLEVEDLVVRYPIHRGLVGSATRQPRRSVHAVEGVSLSLRRGVSLAPVGETGGATAPTGPAALPPAAPPHPAL